MKRGIFSFTGTVAQLYMALEHPNLPVQAVEEAFRRSLCCDAEMLDSGQCTNCGSNGR